MTNPVASLIRKQTTILCALTLLKEEDLSEIQELLFKEALDIGRKISSLESGDANQNSKTVE